MQDWPNIKTLVRQMADGIFGFPSLTVNGLLTLTGASAGQIAFPATQNASADANTLDDYEEGDWTPSVGGSATYTTQTGTYTKIGRQIFVRGVMLINLIGSGNTSVVSGLPFTPEGQTAGSVGYFATLANNVVWLGCRTNGATIVFFDLAAANNTAAQNAKFQNSSQVDFTVVYNV